MPWKGEKPRKQALKGSAVNWGIVMKQFAFAFSFVLMMALVGCGGSTQAQSTQPSSGANQAAETTATATQLDFDGTGFTDTGDGIMVLATAGGTSEDGNIPEIPAMENAMSQLGLNLDGGDGSVCTIYVDGVTNKKANFSKRAQITFTVSGKQLAEGIHTVELVKLDGDTPVVYKKAEYKCV